MFVSATSILTVLLWPFGLFTNIILCSVIAPVIIDASMPVVVRDSGKMWNKLGELEDTKCLIPDRCYATTYQEVISYVKTHGQFDVA